MGASSFRFDRLSLLVVDDNAVMRRLFHTVLEALSVREIRTAASVDEAIKELHRFTPDIVITDWHMEPRDGLDLVHWLRHDDASENPYIPIVMVSGHTEVRRVCQARDAGVNEFLAKPISARSLYTRIAQLIEHPRPFVRTGDYFGPCRRRKNVGPPDGMVERRSDSTADSKLTNFEIRELARNPASISEQETRHG